MASWSPPSPRQWGNVNHIQFDAVVQSLSRLEVSVDDLRQHVEMLPEVLKSSLNLAGGSGSIPWPRQTSCRHHEESQEIVQNHHLEDADIALSVPQSPKHVKLTRRTSRVSEVHQVFEDVVHKVELGGNIELMDVATYHRIPSAQAQESSTGWSRHLDGRRLIIHPASRVCVSLDAFRMLFLMIDAFYVPYSLAFDNSVEGPFLYLASLVVCFWSLELAFNFFTGYMQSGGGVVLRWKAIILKYIKGNFAFDVLAVAADAVALIAGVFPDEFKGGSTLESVRIVRLMKLSRLVRAVAKINAGFAARVRSNFSNWILLRGWLEYEQYVKFVMSLIKLTFVIAWIGHIGSCIWNAVGNHVAPESWYMELRDEINYRQGLYWAITTMFAGASPRRPEGMIEVALAVAWVAMGAMFVTSFTSTLAAMLIDANEKQKEITKKNRLLAAFMGQRNTPAMLAVAVHTDFFEKVRSLQPVMERDVSFLDIVDPQLRANLRECHYGKSFVQHDLFRLLKLLDDDIIKAFCLKASQCFVVKDGENLFQPQQEMRHAMLIISGTMWYTISPATRESITVSRLSSATSTESTQAIDFNPLAQSKQGMTNLVAPTRALRQCNAVPVSEDAWVCELSLFSSWMTVGTLEAEGTCELLPISAEIFRKLVTSKPLLETVVSFYAVQATRLAAEAAVSTDINCGIDSDVVVRSLPPVIRGQLISMPVLNKLRRMRSLINHRSKRTLQDLQDEVRTGRCHLSMNAEGECCRVVMLVVLRLYNEDGRLCVYLAEKTANSSCKPNFRLPGRKLHGHERPDEAIAKFLQEDLAPLAQAVQLQERAKTIIETEMSERFSVRTKYIKIVYEAMFKGSVILGEASTSMPWASESSGPVTLPATTKIGSNPSVGYGRIRSSHSSAVLRMPVRTTTASFGLAKFAKWQYSCRRVETGDGVHSSGVSYGTAPTSGPFPLEGQDHAFAIPRSARESPPQCEDGSQEPEACTHNIFRWMASDEFELMQQRRNDVEKDIRSFPLTSAYLSRLENFIVINRLDARMSCDVKPMEMQRIISRSVTFTSTASDEVETVDGDEDAPFSTI